jgi:hypothetical protein
MTAGAESLVPLEFGPKERQFYDACMELLGDTPFELDLTFGEEEAVVERQVRLELGDTADNDDNGLTITQYPASEGGALHAYYYLYVRDQENPGDYIEIEHFIELSPADGISESYEVAIEGPQRGKPDKPDFLERLLSAKAAHEVHKQRVEERRTIARQAEAPAFGELIDLSAAEAQAIMARIDEGSLQRRLDRAVSDFSLQEYVNAYDLEPVASQQLTESLTCHYSQVVEADNRFAVLAYLEQGDVIKPRFYYLSGSQAVWRYLPFHTEGHYGKGVAEQSLTLPIPMQRALAQLANRHEGQLVEPDLYELASPYGKAAATDILFQDRLELVKNAAFAQGPDRLNFPCIDLAIPQQREALTILPAEEAFGPDVSRVIARWEQDSPLYGRVRYTAVPSRDDCLEYVYAQDPEGRTWIAAVDDITAPIRPNGIRQGYVDLGVLQTPANEYIKRAAQFAGEQQGRYADVYGKLLSKLPIIQAFVESSAATAN